MKIRAVQFLGLERSPRATGYTIIIGKVTIAIWVPASWPILWKLARPPLS